MIRNLIWLVAVAVAWGAFGCRTAPEKPTEVTPAVVPAPAPAPPPQPAEAAGFEEIVLKVEIPAQTAAPEGQPGERRGPHGGAGCPMSESNQLLGIRISRPHGIVVGEVVPDGPAVKAGIKVGDSIVACDGKPVSCPSSLRPMLGRGGKVITVELTIHRPKEAPAKPATGAAPK